MHKTTGERESSSLEAYLSDIRHHSLLTIAGEQSLARAYRRKGDTRAAHRLVSANLRFVVKIAHEYRSYGLNMGDLIQEGNLGLMRAVQKFDPDQGIRLISYAVWWIRAYVQNYCLRSFSLVKLGTTQAQRKLFFSLARTKRELDKMSAEHGLDSDGEDSSKIAKRLKVKPAEVDEMSQRLQGRDISLDGSMGDEGGPTRMDFLVGDGPSQEEEVSEAQRHSRIQGGVGEALARLDPRERYLIEHRAMADEPQTLSEIGERFGVSRERARQLEVRAKEKLKRELRALAVEFEWPAACA